MTEIMLWGRHKDYANGEWIKLLRNPRLQDKAERFEQGFELMSLRLGAHPDDLKDETGGSSIYVACLAAYNNGYLHGCWIDATQGEDHIRGRIQKMLAASPIPDAEEYAIHDHEGFEGAAVCEYDSIENVAAMAAFIEDHGALGGQLLAYYHDLKDARQAMDERYAGLYSSLAEFAQELTEQSTTIPACLEYYIDWDAMGRDLDLNDITAITTAYNKVNVFWNI